MGILSKWWVRGILVSLFVGGVWSFTHFVLAPAIFPGHPPVPFNIFDVMIACFVGVYYGKWLI